MIVLGICDGHDSGACLVKEGVVSAAVSEERLTGKKRQPGFPFRSIDWCLTSTGTDPQRVDRVVLAEGAGRGIHRLFNSRYAKTDPNLPMHRGMNLASMTWQNWVARTGGLSHADGIVSRQMAGRRLRRRGIFCRVELADHHFAHGIGAARASGFEDALVVTQDAYGDGISGTVCRWQAGRLVRLDFVPYPHSPALLFGLTTSYLGFREGDEGKVAGLAGTGMSKHTAWLFEYFLKGTPGGFRMSAFPTLARLNRLFNSVAPRDVAAGLQAHVEGLVAGYVRGWMEKTGARNLCLAGGLFANVRLNQRVAESCACDDLFVFPHMGDGGLCAGAAMEASCSRSFDPFLGPVLESWKTMGGIPIGPETIETIARDLAAGGVVGIAAGRMEFGPRALGNRSLLFSARDPEVADRVNRALSRPALMPFAPAVRDVDWGAVTATPAWSAFDFMACTAQALPGIREKFPTAVHVDGSMRIQHVRRGRTPLLYDILTAYDRHAAPGVLINTSFNRHERPILNDPAEALALYDEIPLQGLILKERYIRRIV